MDEVKWRISALQRLLSAFPAPSQADPDEILRRYIEAVDGCPFEDVRSAVDRFLLGQVPGHNAAFAPSAPELSVEVRRIRDKRLGDHMLRNAAIKQIEEREVEKEGSTASRSAAVKRILDASPQFSQANAERNVAADRSYWESTNQFFQPDMSPDAVKNRLRLWGIGDVEEARDD